jgi:hypothetical protein
MENYLKEPSKEDLRNLISEILILDHICVKAHYNVDELIFSFLLAKYAKGDFSLSFTLDNCNVKLNATSQGKSISFKGREYFIGWSAFSSIFPISVDDIIPILTGIFSSLEIERRGLTEFERNIINDMVNLGVIIEKNLKLPNYKNLPLFFSITTSIDPYIPEMSGNREVTIKNLKEIGINETDKLEEIDEKKTNTLIFKLITNILKINQKFTRDDLVTDRVYYLEYDSLELALASLYFLDVKGIGDIFQLVITPNYAELLTSKYREEIGKGFKIGNIVEKGSYVIVESDLKSPLLLHLILLQQGKARKDKPVYVKSNDGVYTSRYFNPTSLKEGLIKVEDESINKG